MRIGIDLGGTKIAAIAIDRDGRTLAELRRASPQGDYEATLVALVRTVEQLEAETGCGGARVGIGMPGSIAPRSGRVQNANSTWLNGRPLAADLERRLGPRVRFANDANCFALSEATDGAAADDTRVLGVILGTGCGSGIIVARQIMDGPRGIGGEWGHNPLPWPSAEEWPGPRCWCGRLGCMEAWVSGPALAADHALCTGAVLDAAQIAQRADAGDAAARASLDRHADRLARGLAAVVNVVDPDVIVLGGGLSKLAHLYDQLPHLMAPHIFGEDAHVRVVPPRWGDASGVRGAAWLWPSGP
ncbi:MAG: ROK family protein [Hyphomicrobium sp.]|nr:ROK family protein [Hyphomicrobium sp.]